MRFIFPDGFTSAKVQCNISGIFDPALETRVFPQQNVYDCLNIKNTLAINQNVIISGVINPNYELTASGFTVMILQPNSIVAR